jgi:hypothetical protein
MLHKVVKYGAKIRFAVKKNMPYTTKLYIYKYVAARMINQRPGLMHSKAIRALADGFKVVIEPFGVAN